MFNLVKLSITLILIVIIGSPISHAQDAGNALFADEKWPEAANAYEIYLKDNPDDAAIWYQLAVSARQAERFSIALNALIKAEQLQFSPPRIGLERARLKVLANDNDSAVAGLRELAAGGFSSVSVLTNDAVLGVLAGHEGFDALVKQMEVRAYPVNMTRRLPSSISGLANGRFMLLAEHSRATTLFVARNAVACFGKLEECKRGKWK